LGSRRIKNKYKRTTDVKNKTGKIKPSPFRLAKDKQVINTPDAEQLEAKQQKGFLEKKTQSDKMLLCIDWDGTIVKGSLHNALNATFNYQDCVDQFLADETKIGKIKRY
jgi:hypothetical protein